MSTTTTPTDRDAYTPENVEDALQLVTLEAIDTLDSIAAGDDANAERHANTVRDALDALTRTERASLTLNLAYAVIRLDRQLTAERSRRGRRRGRFSV